jgi:hypothetical protein
MTLVKRMSTTTEPTNAAVPSLDEIYQLTAVADERVLFRDVGWSFYELLVASIPGSRDMPVDLDEYLSDESACDRGRREEIRREPEN